MLVIILSSFGLTLIVTQSKILKPVREIAGLISLKLKELLECPMCFGFWSGMICFFLRLIEANFILYGFIGSVVGYVGYLLIKELQDKHD